MQWAIDHYSLVEIEGEMEVSHPIELRSGAVIRGVKPPPKKKG